jgi:cysteine-rich repeat protein
MAVRWVSLLMVLLLLCSPAACSRAMGFIPVCGNELTEPPETCDGDCPSTCDDGNACTVDQMTGDASSCDVRCAHDPIVDCQDGDGCCAPGCNGLNDSDCDPLCGNGVTEPPEMCDGDCPPTCDDLDACTVDQMTGDASDCDIVCAHDPIVICLDGDGCCPGGGLDACHALNDDDCVPVCGNGFLDVDEACDDGNTIDGDGCSADCLSDETCGNGYVDTALGEQCDDGNGVDWDGCTGCAITEFQVNTYTLQSQRNPTVSMAPDGRFVVVWNSAGQDGSLGGVFGQRYDSNGSPAGVEFLISIEQSAPRAVAMASDGSFVVIRDDYLDPAVMHLSLESLG